MSGNSEQAAHGMYSSNKEVYVVDSGLQKPTTYHLYRSCPAIKISNIGPKAVGADSVEELDVCERCLERSKRNKDAHGPCRGLARKLDMLDPDAVGLSALGDRDV